MLITIFGLIAIVVFGALGFFRGAYKIVTAFVSFLIAAMLAKPGSSLLAGVLAGCRVIPQSLASLAGQLLAGLFLFFLFFYLATRLLRKLEERREQMDRPRIALWERIGGAVLGAAWGAFLVIFVLVGLHIIGNVEAVLTPPAPPAAEKAGTSAAAASASPRQVSASAERKNAYPLPDAAPQAAPAAGKKFVALKSQIEKSVFGAVVQHADPVGNTVADTFQDLTAVVNNPSLYSAFKRHPTIARLAADPRIRALSEDKQIQQYLQERRYFELLDNAKIAALLQDGALLSELKTVNLGSVLREVTGNGSDPQAPAAQDALVAKCLQCRGSDGQCKEAYASEQAALQKVFLIQREKGQSLSTYACPFGNGWHLTKAKNGP